MTTADRTPPALWEGALTMTNAQAALIAAALAPQDPREDRTLIEHAEELIRWLDQEDAASAGVAEGWDRDAAFEHAKRVAIGRGWMRVAVDDYLAQHIDGGDGKPLCGTEVEPAPALLRGGHSYALADCSECRLGAGLPR